MIPIILLIALIALCLWQWINARPRGTVPMANDGALTVGEHQGGRITGYHQDAPVTVRFLLVKQNASADNYFNTPTSVADLPIGVCYDEPAAVTDPVEIHLLGGADKTLKMRAAAAINAGQVVCTNGDGYVRALPAVAGVYYSVGVAVTSALVAGDFIEVQPGLQQWGVSIVT